MPDTLNDRQRQAVTAKDGPVLVVAGPGTGKTKTLTERIAYLLQQKKATASEILALTFTKKAAEEMAQRVTTAHGSASPKITTFHGLCHELLGAEMQFISDVQRLQLIKSLSRPVAFKEFSARELGLLISNVKNSLESAEPALAKITKAYNKALHDQNLHDFDDLLLETYELLKHDDAVRTAVQERFGYIFVDEFQDTNGLQYELLKLLRGTDNIFVIGDPNQSIYGFRGASGTIFQQFKQDFPSVLEITLDVNYRSSPEIVKVSNAIFAQQPQLKAHSTAPGTAQTVLVLNEYSEAEWILGEIQRAIGGGDFLKAVSDDDRTAHKSLRDFAILYRSRSVARTIQKMIAESGLPYQIVGDGSPYEKPEVQAIITLLRAATTGEDPKLEGFSAGQVRQIVELMQLSDQAVPHVLAEKIIKTLGLEPNRDLSQCINTLVRFETVPAALRYFDDIAERGFYDPAADAITLLTIHAAKGLEFPHVFLIGAEQGILPNARADEAEERRLLYVAVTRAKEKLEVLHTKRRGGELAELSSFITGLPMGTLDRIVDPNIETQARRLAKRQAKRSQQRLF